MAKTNEKTRKEKVSDALQEIEKEMKSFEMNGGKVYYDVIEDIELMYIERLHLVALACKHLRTDAKEDYKAGYWQGVQDKAVREMRDIMRQIKFENSRGEHKSLTRYLCPSKGKN